MCHDYAAWSRKAETAAKKRKEDVKPEVAPIAVARPEEKAKPARERIEERELEPAE